MRLVAAQAETLWDEALPIEVRELADDLAALDGLLCDRALLAPFVEHWERVEALLSGRLGGRADSRRVCPTNCV